MSWYGRELVVGARGRGRTKALTLTITTAKSREQREGQESVDGECKSARMRCNAALFHECVVMVRPTHSLTDAMH